MAPTLTHRLAEVEDAGAIARLHVQAWKAAYASIVPVSFLERLSVEPRAQQWAQILAETPGSVTLAFEGAALRGWISAGPDRDGGAGGEIYALYVDPTTLRRGVGGRLLDLAEQSLRSAGHRSARLWVLEANRNARRFYERHAYAPDGATKTIVLDEVPLVEVRYVKAL